MRRSSLFYVGLIILGACMIAASVFFRSEDTKPIGGCLIGIGAGLIGMSLSVLIAKRIERNHPERQRQARIDYNDERNTIIRYRAKARAGDITQWLVMGIAYITILISAPLWLTLTIVIVFVIHNVLSLYLMAKFQKEM